MKMFHRWATVVTVFCFMSTGVSLLLARGAGSDLQSPDNDFVENAAKGGLAEVELGQLAQDKASNSRVKAFAEMMISDHGKANQDLSDRARRLGLTLPDHMSVLQMEQKTRLSAYSGAHFDRSYIDVMVKDHQEDVQEFQREANEGKNEALKAFAAKTLPVLQKHLRLAEQIQKEFSGNAQTLSGGTGR